MMLPGANALLLVFVLALQIGVTNAPQQVFVQRDVNAEAMDRLTFVDMLTGEETTLLVDGERYTATDGGVLYFDRAVRRPRLALADGTVGDQPLMRMPPDARRIDWLVADGGRLAWTITSGRDGALTTSTWVCGGGCREVLVDGARDGIRALPVGFDVDGGTLYLDYQPDVIGELTPFRQYAGLFALDLAAGTTTPLPGEPGCFCGAGVGAGRFVRLALNDDASGFDARVVELATGAERRIPALPLVGYTQAGDVLVAGDGRRAVYALAQVTDFGTPAQQVRTVFVVIDLDAGTQAALTDPITTYVKPMAWTEEDSAILFTSPTRDGTWKIRLDDGTLVKLADATYVGMVGG